MPQSKIVTIAGTVFLVGINVLYGRQFIEHYMSNINVASNNVTETALNHYASFARGNTKLDPPDRINTTAKATNNDTKELEHHKLTLSGRRDPNIPYYNNTLSPACKPHFLLANRPNEPLQWTNFSKFKRLYFHHARKAGECYYSHFTCFAIH